jgi:exonuclease III
MMLRAQELKEYKNLCKGNKPTPINASESTESFIAKANCVNISLGTNTEMINSNVDLILTKDLMGRKEFLEKNPEINLPADLEINLDLENFPSLVSQSNTLTSAPLKEVDESLENSWVRITSKGLKPSSSKNVNNDRCNLECRGLNKRGKLQCITDFMYENKLDFMDFQETKKDSFHESVLIQIHKDFSWNYLPTEGTAGGILVGLNSNKFEALAWRKTKSYVVAMIRNMVDKFVWRFVSVYGSSYEEGKADFIQELHEIMDNWSGPTLLRGDFNLVNNLKEKSNGLVNKKWVDLFKDCTNCHGLVELKNSSRSFTWTNSQEQPIMAAVDKFLCNNSFEQQYSLAFVTTISRAGSDHVPLVINLHIDEPKKPSVFRFEKWWLNHLGFKEFVAEVWNTDCIFTDPIEICQFKLDFLERN